MQLGKALGATVIATASKRNTEFVASLGASQVIDYTSTQFQDVLAAPEDKVFLLHTMFMASGRDHPMLLALVRALRSKPL